MTSTTSRRLEEIRHDLEEYPCDEFSPQEVRSLIEVIDKLKEALEFYAKDTLSDAGYRARAVLKDVFR